MFLHLIFFMLCVFIQFYMDLHNHYIACKDIYYIFPILHIIKQLYKIIHTCTHRTPMLYIFTPKFAQIGVGFCTLYLHKVLKSRYPYYSYTMLGIESKIADAQWNQMYAHSPPNSHRPAALPPHPNQRQRAKNNPKKEMHKNGIKCTPHTAVSPSPPKPTWY